jgi:protein translocase SecG subunit
MNIYNYVTLVSAAIMILLILVQTRGADLGAGLGGGGEVNTVRRGSDRTLHQMTVIMAFIFAGSLILYLVA